MLAAGHEGTAAFLMGRKLYEEWSAYWSRTDQDQDFATFINNAR
jgi:hypothetical protein